MYSLLKGKEKDYVFCPQKTNNKTRLSTPSPHFMPSINHIPSVQKKMPNKKSLKTIRNSYHLCEATGNLVFPGALQTVDFETKIPHHKRRNFLHLGASFPGTLRCGCPEFFHQLGWPQGWAAAGRFDGLFR